MKHSAAVCGLQSVHLQVLPLDTMIEFRNVSHRFGLELLFSGLSFRIAGGEKAAVRGPSGSGKSSLLNLIMGFNRPVEGEILIAGSPITPRTIRKVRMDIGWAPQNFSARGRVQDYILTPFAYRVNRRTRPGPDRVRLFLEMLMLEESILHKNMEDLSGGQKQRIALLIVCLLGRPIVLLDEATAALDDDAKAAVMNLFFNMQGVTLLSTSHDGAWLERCDRIIEINNGRR